MNKIFVVARNFNQFTFYTHGSPLFEFIDRPEKLIGRRGFYVIYVGEWYENRDIVKIQEEIDAREPIVIKIN
jgi:hypothetical protein